MAGWDYVTPPAPTRRLWSGLVRGVGWGGVETNNQCFGDSIHHLSFSYSSSGDLNRSHCCLRPVRLLGDSIHKRRYERSSAKATAGSGREKQPGDNYFWNPGTWSAGPKIVVPPNDPNFLAPPNGASNLSLSIYSFRGAEFNFVSAGVHSIKWLI